MEFLIGWLFLAFIVGALASSRGLNGIGWFIGAILISPLLAGILVLLQQNRKVSAPLVATAPPSPGSRLHELADLHERGVLTDVEYEAKRAELVERL